MLDEMRKIAIEQGNDPAGVEVANWVNHDIRRTVRTGLSRLGIREEVSEAVLAHVQGGIKGNYNLYGYLDEKRIALERWAAHVHRLVEPSSNVVPLTRRVSA